MELLTGDRLFDLVAEGIDVAIRVGNLSDSRLRAVQVDSFVHWLVATPAWLGHPEMPTDTTLQTLRLPIAPPSPASIPFRSG